MAATSGRPGVEQLSPTAIYEGKTIFLIGGTGFLGKVTLSILLHRFPNIRRVFVTVRAPSAAESASRFWNSVLATPPFEPLRERYGDAFEGFIREKVRVVGGDVGEANLGYSDGEAQAIADEVDIVINGAGKVTFNPALEAALRTNVIGTQNVIDFAKRMRRPALIHTSTCFVAGNRSGPVSEDDPVLGYFPRHEDMPGVEFSVHREIADCERLAARVKDEASDATMVARFTQLARERLIDEGRDPDDPGAIATAMVRERKAWTRARLTELGVERAAWWGWPNIYTYTKSLGEKLVAAEAGIIRSIVRPSIVESALSYPMPGWNEGFTTTAPLILMILKGQAQIPADDTLLLDVTPVDEVAAVLLAVAAEALVGEPALVYQAATGDSNPFNVRRVVELTGLYKRRHLRGREGRGGTAVVNRVMGAMEARTVSVKRFDRTSTPMFNSAAKSVSSLLERVKPRFGGGRVSDVIELARTQIGRFEHATGEAQKVFEMFRPFIVENSYVFGARNVRRLMSRIRPEERPLLRWQPESIDWFGYWLDVHVPGLDRWVFPKLEEELRVRPPRRYTHRDLIELFDTATKRFSTRVAMRIDRSGRSEQYTYADLQEAATRGAGFLAASGVTPGDRVLLVGHNAPEWGVSYFSILKAGATCVPVDPESSAEEIVRLATASGATGCVISERVAALHPDLRARLRLSGSDAIRLWRFAELFAIPDEETERQRNALLPARVQGHALASLIFTSGTTGQPKGVMLSHRNLTSMVSMLASVFDLGPRDGLLSVLPLHHTFEFSAGFVTPLSQGSRITYLNETTREELLSALIGGRITAMVGVPALWDSLHRRIRSDMRERGPWVDRLSSAMMLANAWVRDRTPINLGPVLFAPVHSALGGKLRFLVSGGAALSQPVKRDLHALGFTILEGYGLTEASPVLTVTRPGNRLFTTSVGTALPGVEIRIAGADERGVGEVIARGGNIMLGYYGNEEATRGALEEGWLRTGDIGRLDPEGHLHLVGRSKEIIVDSDGRNVYPDDVEHAYTGSPWIREMCVVGLPDGVAEKVAGVVVPDYGHDVSLSRADVRSRIEEHVRNRSTTLPYHKRIKILHITEDDLPRTATRKVKRRELAAMLAVQQPYSQVVVAGTGDTIGTVGGRSAGAPAVDAEWLVPVVAAVCNRPRSSITVDTRLEELGFDSLMYVELAAAVEQAGGSFAAPDRLHEIRDLRELGAAVTRNGRQTRPVSTVPPGRAAVSVKKQSNDIRLPSLVRTAGAAGLGALQKVFYDNVLDSRYEGRERVPVHTNFIVAANHASHLDMGLVKMALGDQGRDLVALAAADYFFDNRYKRAYVENFTNLVPIERSGSLRQSLRHARSYLDQGYNALIFPEGTRSVTGTLVAFKPVIGFLALSARVGILPVHLAGTHEALPKGAGMLRARGVGARIGRFLSIEELEAMTARMPNSAAHRLIAARVRHEIVNLRDGTNHVFDAEALKRRWSDERTGAAEAGSEPASEPRPVDEGATIGD
ncbi:MAG: AMP-binding protein [Gemmatimonadaceae bacterium]